MNLPKIKFTEMALDKNIDIVTWAYFEDDATLGAHNFALQCFPDLASLDRDLPHDEIEAKIQKIVAESREKSKARIKSEIARYSSLWQKYNDSYFETLAKYLEVAWPSNIKTIEAMVGQIPVFPRYLDDFAFAIGSGIDDAKLVEVCAHETLHFLWFRKWQQMYPETPRREYDSPFLVWQYSEMVTDPILNNEPFVGMFDFTERGYDSFYTLEDNGVKVMDKLRSIYSKNMSIEEKIAAGFQYIRKIIR